MNLFELKGLQKNYPGFSLENLNLCLPGGCMMGLIGKNGAGKSTTIKLMLGMIKKDAGTIRVFGQDACAAGARMREDVGAVLDSVGLPPCMNAMQIGRMMAHTFRRWSQETYLLLLNRLAIPQDKPFETFSRGTAMKQGIAIALSHQARLLLLDEATSGLDPVARDEVLELLREFVQDEDHAVLLSSHIVSDLEKVCDYVAFLHQGKLLLCEEKDRLLEDYGVVHCTPQALAALPPNAVVGKRESAYGVDAVVRRAAAPHSMTVSPVDIEELFVYMEKGAL